MKVRYYTIGDEEQVLALYKKVWTSEFAKFMENNWRWKFLENPYIKDLNQAHFVCEKEGRIIGFIGTLPAPVKLGDSYVSGTWGADLMVEPESRGRAGMQLIRAFVSNSDYVFGHMGPELLKIWLKILNIPEANTTTLQYCESHLGFVGFAARLKQGLPLFNRKYSIPPDYQVSYEMPKHFDYFLKQWCASHGNIFIRNEDWFNWRFIKMPGREYRIHYFYRLNIPCGYMVTRKLNKNTLLIVDILCNGSDHETWKVMLKQSQLTAAELRLRKVRFHLPNETAARIASRNLNFHPLLSQIGYAINGASKHAEKHALLKENVNNSWHITFADSDLELSLL